jgi:hypothetical protein
MEKQVEIKPGAEVNVIPEEKAYRPVCKKWSICEECGKEVLTDIDGTFYHLLSCSRSNGIGYGEERNKFPLDWL